MFLSNRRKNTDDLGVSQSFETAQRNIPVLMQGLKDIGLSRRSMDMLSIMSIASFEVYNNAIIQPMDNKESYRRSENESIKRREMRLLTPEELGMPATGSFRDGKCPRRYSYQDHVYQCENGAAAVYEIEDDGKKSIMVAFRGTDGIEDFKHYVNFANHYKLFEPLVKSIREYALSKDSAQVYVTGHSLGGATAQEFMNEHAMTGEWNSPRFNFFASKLKSITFGSPGACHATNIKDSRILHIQHPEDFVPKIGRVLHKNSGHTINIELDKKVNKKDFRKYELLSKDPEQIKKKTLKCKLLTIATLGTIELVRMFINRANAHRMRGYVDSITNSVLLVAKSKDALNKLKESGIPIVRNPLRLNINFEKLKEQAKLNEDHKPSIGRPFQVSM